MAALPAVGILALQGNFAMHTACFNTLGVNPHLIKTPAELAKIDGLVLPGGESSAMLKLLSHDPSWFSALTQFFQQGKPIFGTCAGIILLAREVIPQQKSLNFLDVMVHRNAYGRQLESKVEEARLLLNQHTYQLPLTFIRAPKIQSFGTKVKPLAYVGREVVLVEEGPILGATCHPEATTTLVHQYFLEKCAHNKALH